MAYGRYEMRRSKNDPNLCRYFGSTELVIVWLGRRSLFKTFDEIPNIDIEEIRLLLDDALLNDEGG
jgi:hypothetical protein